MDVSRTARTLSLVASSMFAASGCSTLLATQPEELPEIQCPPAQSEPALESTRTCSSDEDADVVACLESVAPDVTALREWGAAGWAAVRTCEARANE